MLLLQLLFWASVALVLVWFVRIIWLQYQVRRISRCIQSDAKEVDRLLSEKDRAVPTLKSVDTYTLTKISNRLMRSNLLR